MGGWRVIRPYENRTRSGCRCRTWCGFAAISWS